MNVRNLLKTIAVLAIVTATATSAFAQVNSGATNVTLNATVGESLTINLDQTNVTFALTPGNATNAGNTGINVTTKWSLNSSRSSVQLYAYFDTPAQALVSGTNYIPSSDITATVGGTSVGAFTATTPFGTASGVTLLDQAITTANDTGTNVSAVALNINLTSLPSLPAGAYAGLLHFQAQAI